MEKVKPPFPEKPKEVKKTDKMEKGKKMPPKKK